MKFFSAIFFSAIVFSASGQSGKVLESQKFTSKIVSYPVEYSVYLPPDYETSQRSYPVVYLLHGFSDDETGWIQYGEANQIADQGIKNGDFPPCILVMPDAKATWYCNKYDGSDKWEDMFITEFIPFVEKSIRARGKKEFRAILGLSMGGNGALALAMRHPELFSSCIAFSAAMFTDTEITSLDSYNVYFKDLFGANLTGVSRVNDQWKAYSPLHIVDTGNLEKLKSVKYYIDCGDDDFLYKGNSSLHEKMRDKGIPHEFRVRDGAHEWMYWRTGLPEGLKFAAKQFIR
jgi:S-formylglutathione hydrolase FrmB